MSDAPRRERMPEEAPPGTEDGHEPERDCSPESTAGRVLIAGCGALGCEAGLELVERGWKVWGLRRSPEKLPPEIVGIGADLAADSSSLGAPSLEAAELPQADVLLYVLSADGFDDDAYRRAYVDGLRNLLAALADRERLPRRLVYVSSTSVYGQADGSWVDETSATEPSGFSGRRLLEGESLALDAARLGTVGGATGGAVESTAVIRFGGIYGPTRTRLLRKILDGEAECRQNPVVWTNRIHSTDAARALVHLVRTDSADGVYVGVDREPAPDCQVQRFIARLAGVAEPPAAEGEPSRQSRAMRSNKRCSSRRLLDSGFALRYPTFREGYGELLDDR